MARGSWLVVLGRIRRRYFRTAAGTASRTEVVASVVVRSRQRARVAAIADRAIAELGRLDAAAA